jgi:hypothetical protein
VGDTVIVGDHWEDIYYSLRLVDWNNCHHHCYGKMETENIDPTQGTKMQLDFVLVELEHLGGKTESVEFVAVGAVVGVVVGVAAFAPYAPDGNLFDCSRPHRTRMCLGLH